MRKKSFVLLLVLFLTAFTPMVFAIEFDNYLKFDGDDDYVEISSHASLNLGADDFTIEFWFRPDMIIEASAYDYYWMSWYDEALAPDISMRLSVNTDATTPKSLITVLLYDFDWTSDITLDTWSAPYQTDMIYLLDGEWHHYVLVRNETHGTLWIDDVFISVAEEVGDLGSLDTSTSIFIGGNFYDPNSWEGDMAEIRIYTRELSSAERTYSFTNQEPQSETGLVMWLRFNDGEGDTASDSAGDNDGVLMPDFAGSNAPEWFGDPPVEPAEPEPTGFERFLSSFTPFMAIFGILLAISFLVIFFSIFSYTKQDLSVIIVPLFAVLTVAIILLVIGMAINMGY